MNRDSYLENVGARNAQQQLVRSRELRGLYEQGKGYGGPAGGIQVQSAQ